MKQVQDFASRADGAGSFARLNVRHRRVGARVLAVPVAMATTILILLLHAMLLPEGHWQGDEYIGAAFARDGHLRYLWQARIAGWSPRPFSEILFYAYVRVATILKQPVIVPFLALLWAMLFASPLITWQRRKGASVRILVGLATSCMFLLGQPVAEMFYWPAGAVAYLPTLAATSLALFLLADGRTASLSGGLALSASLAIGAASSESGTLAVVFLSVVLAIYAPSRGRALLMLLPLLVAGFVLWTLAHHRMGAAVNQAAPVRHLLRSLRPVPRALLADIVASWPSKLAFAVGLRWCWAAWTGSARPHPVLPAFAAALLAGAAATIAASYFQTGTLCCERHDSLRRDWIILALAALAIWSTRWPPRPELARWGAPAVLLACLLGVAPRIDAFVSDFRLMRGIAAIDRGNWRAGRDAQMHSMVLRLPPPAAIAGPVVLPPGRYQEPAETAWFAHGIMQFFGKESLIILPPQGAS